MARSRTVRWVAIIAVQLAALILFAAIAFCEASLYISTKFRRPEPPGLARAMAQDARASWRDVEIPASDGIHLRAWLFTPWSANGDAVIVLHGIADNRAGMSGCALMLLAHSYAVLVPDSRGHGSSDGDLMTFGVKEADDTRRWVEWLAETTHPRKIFGLGESMGAANLLQALPIEPRLRAVVAEAPFANLPSIAYDRLGMFLRIGPRWRRPLFWPVIDTAVLYGRFRYGIWLPDASPERAVARASTPVLLIRDGRDDRMPPWHIDALRAANPRLALWDVPEAIHTGAFGAEPEEFARRVTGWFEAH